MSIQYDIYLKNHITSVIHAGAWIFDHCPLDKLDAIFPDLNITIVRNQLPLHDQSKYMPEEYEAYDRYFYRDGKDSYEGKKNFDKAWLHHIHNNPHHWQHWILLEDDGSGNPKPLDMPDNYIFEMICDWWSFSWRSYFESMKTDEGYIATQNEKNLYELYNWYDEHKSKMYLSETTRVKVEQILDLIHNALDEVIENVSEIATKNI